ncbi:MAG: hypothetical protein QM831_01640 [Kofleriaceae bacterium]
MPDRPTYLVTARSVRGLQQGSRALIDAAGILLGVSADQAGQELARVLTIDPLSEAGTKQLGIDPEGAIAVFSEATDPTIVVKLSDPAATQAFFDQAKQRVKTSAIIIDGVEVTGAKIERDVSASWAIDHSMLWVHFSFGLDKTDDWFTPTHHPRGQSWKTGFASLRSFERGGLLGFIDTQQMLAVIKAKAKEAATCIDSFHDIHLASFSITAEGPAVGGKLAFDIGSRGADLQSVLLPAPPGFTAIAKGAPIAAQWNLDLAAIQRFLTPCMQSVGAKPDKLMKMGVRAGRVIVKTLDPSGPSGTGVVSLDVANKAELVKYLDMIPHRSMFEGDETFAGQKGKRIKVPFVVTLDYILDDARAIVAIGDNLMEQVLSGQSAAPPVAELAIDVDAMKPEAWSFVLEHATNEWFAKHALERLMRWQRGNIRVTVDQNQLVIDAAGTRK